jgi:hypothetical protein
MKQATAIVLITLLFVVLESAGRPRPSAHGGGQSEVWEITVAARSHRHTHGVTNKPDEHGVNDIDESYTVYLSERLKGSYLDGRIDLGEEPELVGTPTASGSAAEIFHNRLVVERDLQEQWISRDGSLEPPPQGAGAHFAWDGPTREAVFEVGAHYTGTEATRDHTIMVGNDVDRTTSHSEAWVQSALFGGSGKHPLRVTQTKTGFDVDWSWSESSGAPGGATTVTTQDGHADIHRYVPHEPMELVVSPAGYQTWLPQAGQDQKTPGNRLAVQATLKTKNGKPIPEDQKAARIHFELTGVSREPGICMNVPFKIETLDDNDPDLQFAPAGAMKLSPADHPNAAETPDGQDGLTSAAAVIASYDWGAYGSLRVTAQLDDGETILGHLEGKPDTDILVPRRNARSEHTAAYWKEQRGIALPDDDDSEKLAGDRRPGDGYTVYEEYRGFIEGGTHIFGDPTRKDLMVRDRIGGRSKDGIRLFEAITGIVVHDNFAEEEVESGRMMNDNYSGMTHEVDQHGLVIQEGESKDTSRTTGTPGGPPGQHPLIEIAPGSGPDDWNVVRRGRGTVMTDEYASTIAHEMLHACGVLHHGESDPGYVCWTKGSDASGKEVIVESGYTKSGDKKTVQPAPDGHPVDVRYESGRTVSPALFANPTLVWIGAAGGQHSGVTDCVMRYDVAEAYSPAAGSPIRYYVKEEAGITLCDRKPDTAGGVNRPDRTPQSRYGDASKGDCVHQILVRDRQ